LGNAQHILRLQIKNLVGQLKFLVEIGGSLLEIYTRKKIAKTILMLNSSNLNATMATPYYPITVQI